MTKLYRKKLQNILLTTKYSDLTESKKWIDRYGIRAVEIHKKMYGDLTNPNFDLATLAQSK